VMVAMFATLMNVQQALNMVTDAAVLFILASGLAVIFGLMKVINFAHGAFITVGAYVGAEATNAAFDPWLVIPLSLVIGLAVGLVVEVGFIRRVYADPWDTILATIAIGLVTVAAISVVFGRETRFVNTPLTGAIDLGIAEYSSYRVFLLLFAIGLFALWWTIHRFTRLGLVARAVIANEGLASSLGINSSRVRRWTFGLGAGLAALAGALVAPLAAVEPNQGERYLVASFMVVMVAGSSVSALAVGSLIFGAAASWVTFVVDPIVGSVTIIILTAAILRFFPTGFEGFRLGQWASRPRAGRSRTRTEI
jgi:branched-subunit amino acid ABC-type transport system permease component